MQHNSFVSGRMQEIGLKPQRKETITVNERKRNHWLKVIVPGKLDESRPLKRTAQVQVEYIAQWHRIAM